MPFHPLRCGGYGLLILTGWAAGRWVGPAGGGRDGGLGGDVVVVSGSGGGGARGLGGAGDGGGKRLGPAAAGAGGGIGTGKAGRAVDGKAVGLELRAAGSEGAFRDRARLMALEPPPALMDFLGAVTDSETVRQVLLEDAVQWAYCREPEKGLALLSSLGGREEIRALAEKTLHFFPPKDLPVVMAWFRGLPEAGLKAAARGELFKVLAGRDFSQAAAVVASMPTDSGEKILNRRAALVELAQLGNSVMDPAKRAALMDAARGWLPEDLAALTQKAEEREIILMLRSDREAVVERLASVGDGGSALKTEDFFSSWAESDPIRAAQGLEKLPAERKTPETYRQFAAKWAKGNVGMASQWVKDLPEGAGKQAGVQGLVGSLAADYPAEAVIWAGTLTDSRVKISQLREVLAKAGAWTGPAAEKVGEAIAGLNLTPGEQAELHTKPTP